jgi:hypothetical protein
VTAAVATSGGLVFASIAARSGALVILDAGRRLYVGLSHDKSYWHVVSPSQIDDALTCTCKGWAFHRTCYRLDEAAAFELGQLTAPAPDWMQPDYDAPVGAGESVEASRG